MVAAQYIVCITKNVSAAPYPVLAILTDVGQYIFIVVLIWFSLGISDIELFFFMHLFTISMFSF